MHSALRELSVDSFVPCIEDTFTVATEEGAEPMAKIRLIAASKRREDQQTDRPFFLHYEGSAETPLEQCMYWLGHPALGELPIFIVPIAKTQEGLQYEAVFN